LNPEWPSPYGFAAKATPESALERFGAVRSVASNLTVTLAGCFNSNDISPRSLVECPPA